MKPIKYTLLGLMLLGGWVPQTLLSKTITLINSAGETTYLEVGASDHFLEIMDCIQSYYHVNVTENVDYQSFGKNGIAEEGIPLKGPLFDFEISHAGITVRAKKSVYRDYNVSVHSKHKKDIYYIITTLANDSLLSIGTTSISSLKRAGDRIDHLHPFRFLMTIFTHEELKVGARAIRDRGSWTWEGFTDGITGSLKEEASRDNLLAFVEDFAQKVKIDSALILPALQQGRWMDFVNILIDKIPRETNPNRYDM